MIRSIFNRFSSGQDFDGEQVSDRPVQEFVIVPKSTVERCTDDPASLVQSVLSYVGFMVEDGGYALSELPSGAVHTYHCDRYAAKVKSGGHLGFARATGDEFAREMAAVLQALSALKAKGQLKSAKAAAKWAKKNAALMQDGLEEIDEVADDFAKFDEIFHTAESATSLKLQTARWIATWPYLLIVEDAKLSEALRVAAGGDETQPEDPSTETQAFPDEPTTDTQEHTDPITHALCDPLLMGLGMAAARSQPAEALVKIGADHDLEVGDDGLFVWEIETTSGSRLVATDDETGVRLFSRTDVGADEIDAEQIGAQRSTVSIDELEIAQQMAIDLKAGHVIAELIDQIYPKSEFCAASIGRAQLDGNGQPDMWVIVALDGGRKAFSVLLNTSGGTAFEEPTHDCIGQVFLRDPEGDIPAAA